MRQYAPFPEMLADIVDRAHYKPGWRITLENIERDNPDTHSGGAGGLTLVIYALTPDAYNPIDIPKRGVLHYFPVPAATYDERSWRRWVLDCLIKIETHEACEFFALAMGEDHDYMERPFAPNHGPGRDPYTIFDYASDEDRRTSFRGEVKD